MISKVLVLASAVTAFEDKDDTSSFVTLLCATVQMEPTMVPTLIGTLLKSYAPKNIADNVDATEDLAFTGDSAVQGCKSYKAGSSYQQAFGEQWDVLKTGGLAAITNKGAHALLGKDSKIGALAADALSTYLDGGLDTQVSKAKALVKLIRTAEKDEQTEFRFDNLLNENDAKIVNEALSSIETELNLPKYNSTNNPEGRINCGSPLYTELQKIVKKGLYDELFSRVHDLTGTKTGSIGDIATQLGSRVAVSKAISFTDCSATAPDHIEGRVLLA